VRKHISTTDGQQRKHCCVNGG